MEGEGNVKVLLVPPLVEQHLKYFLELLDEEHLREWFTFFLPHPLPLTSVATVDVEKLLEMCRQMIREHNITVVFANQQIGILLSAILSQEFAKISAVNIESVFLCSHKFYTWKYLNSRVDKLPCSAIAVKDDAYEFAVNVMSEIALPCSLSGAYQDQSWHAHDRDELMEAVKKCGCSARKDKNLYFHLIDPIINDSKYSYASKSMIVASNYIEPQASAMTQDGPMSVKVFVEAYVFEGELVPWAMVSEMIPSHRALSNQFFMGYEMPSGLPQCQQTNLWSAFKSDVKNLQKIGFNNSFVYGQYEVYRDGYIHLIKLVPTAHTELTHLYRHALSQGNNLHAALQLALGIKPDPPKPNGSHVVCHRMQMKCMSPGKLSDVIRFDKAAAHDGVILRCLPEDQIDKSMVYKTIPLGIIVVKGADVEVCLNKILEIRNEVLRKPKLVPLTRPFSSL